MKGQFILLLVMICLFPCAALGSSIDGTIDPQYHYAWSKDFGWLNFAADQGTIHVTDSGLVGYIWSPNGGWINLAPLHSGQQVGNDGEGHLSGSAWGETIGWFGFSGITIDADGLFHGTSVNSFGQAFTFDCDQCSVKTDWRPASVRAGHQTTGGTAGGGSNSSAVSLSPPSVMPMPILIPPTIRIPVLIPQFPNTGFGQNSQNISW